MYHFFEDKGQLVGLPALLAATIALLCECMRDLLGPSRHFFCLLVVNLFLVHILVRACCLSGAQVVVPTAVCGDSDSSCGENIKISTKTSASAQTLQKRIQAEILRVSKTISTPAAMCENLLRLVHSDMDSVNIIHAATILQKMNGHKSVLVGNCKWASFRANIIALIQSEKEHCKTAIWLIGCLHKLDRVVEASSEDSDSDILVAAYNSFAHHNVAVLSVSDLVQLVSVGTQLGAGTESIMDGILSEIELRVNSNSTPSSVQTNSHNELSHSDLLCLLSSKRMRTSFVEHVTQRLTQLPVSGVSAICGWIRTDKSVPESHKQRVIANYTEKVEFDADLWSKCNIADIAFMAGALKTCSEVMLFLYVSRMFEFPYSGLVRVFDKQAGTICGTLLSPCLWSGMKNQLAVHLQSFLGMEDRVMTTERAKIVLHALAFLMNGKSTCEFSPPDKDWICEVFSNSNFVQLPVKVLLLFEDTFGFDGELSKLAFDKMTANRYCADDLASRYSAPAMEVLDGLLTSFVVCDNMDVQLIESAAAMVAETMGRRNATCSQYPMSLVLSVLAGLGDVSSRAATSPTFPKLISILTKLYNQEMSRYTVADPIDALNWLAVKNSGNDKNLPGYTTATSVIRKSTSVQPGAAVNCAIRAYRIGCKSSVVRDFVRRQIPIANHSQVCAMMEMLGTVNSESTTLQRIVHRAIEILNSKTCCFSIDQLVGLINHLSGTAEIERFLHALQKWIVPRLDSLSVDGICHLAVAIEKSMNGTEVRNQNERANDSPIEPATTATNTNYAEATAISDYDNNIYTPSGFFM